jgi:hypothetical protein
MVTHSPSPKPRSTTRPALTAEERKAVKSLMIDSGYSRAEAVAWVKHFGTDPL